MANPREDAQITGRVPSIAVSDVSLLAGQESYIGPEAMTPRVLNGSLSRSAVVGNLNLAAEEDFIGMHRLRANTDSLRRPGVYTNRAYDNCIPCDDYQENEYEDLASITAKQNAPRKKSNEIYESAKRTPVARRKQNEVYETAVSAPFSLKVPPRSRNVTECSDDSLNSYQSSSAPGRSRQTCLHNLVLFLVLVFSLVAFSLVILQIFGIVQTPCGCEAPKQAGPTHSAIRGDNPEIDELKKKFEDLLKKFSQLKQELAQTRQEQKEKGALLANTTNELAKVKALVVPFDSKPPIEIQELNATLSELKVNVSHTQHDIVEVNSTQTKFQNETQAAVQRLDQEENHLSSEVDIIRNETRRIREMYGQQESLLSIVQEMLRNQSRRIDFVDARTANLSRSIPTQKPGTPVRGASFSSCTMRNFTSSPSTSNKLDIYYYFQKDRKVMGATCSSIKKDSNDVQVDAFNTLLKLNNSGKDFLKCVCNAKVSMDKTRWLCRMYVWECLSS